MNAVTTAKLGLAMAGVVAFGIGVRIDSQPARWAGVALVTIAFLLRFYRTQR